MQILLAVALAGAAGALCRFGLCAWVQGAFPAFPWATLAVNVLGCLLFGLCWALFLSHQPALVHAAVFAGFLASFTTFSTFAFETVVLLQEGRAILAVANVVLQNAIGCAALFLGLLLGRLL